PFESGDEDMRRFEAIDHWCAAQLSPIDMAYLRTFQPTVELPLGAGATLLCCHGSPLSNTDIIRATTPDDELERMLGGRRATVLAGGHTHTQTLRRSRNLIVLTPGSVGLPFEHDPATGRTRNPPWAEYAIVDWADGKLSIELRRVPVDVAEIVRAARASDMPHG